MLMFTTNCSLESTFPECERVRKLQQEAQIMDLKTLGHCHLISPSLLIWKAQHSLLLHPLTFTTGCQKAHSARAPQQGVAAFREPEIGKQAVLITWETLDSRIQRAQSHHSNPSSEWKENIILKFHSRHGIVLMDLGDT